MQGIGTHAFDGYEGQGQARPLFLCHNITVQHVFSMYEGLEQRDGWAIWNIERRHSTPRSRRRRLGGTWATAQTWIWLKLEGMLLLHTSLSSNATRPVVQMAVLPYQ